MKRRLGITCAALACSVITATAQMDTKLDDTVTVTGCVASGAGGFVLNNAANATSMMMEKDKMAMADKDKMSGDKMAKDKMAMGKDTWPWRNQQCAPMRWLAVPT